MAVSFIANAQVDLPEDELVLYDPLFWKDQLKLDDDQCQKIKEINSEFYEKLSAVAQEEPDHKAARELAQETLIQRSEGIWETFHPKQRKRWKKIWQDKDRT
jgi:CRISPR/Cas system-associated protein Csm6